jgi:hypothetical protein
MGIKARRQRLDNMKDGKKEKEAEYRINDTGKKTEKDMNYIT